MRAMTCGIFMVAGLTIAALSIWIEGNPVHAQRNPLQQRMGKGLLALTVPVGPDKEFVALVDPIQKVMGVYQIDAESGEILLKSVRNVNWDLQLDEFNGSSPSPREIFTAWRLRATEQCGPGVTTTKAAWATAPRPIDLPRSR